MINSRRVTRQLNEERIAFSKMALGQLDSHIQKNEVWLLPHTILYTKLKQNGL